MSLPPKITATALDIDRIAQAVSARFRGRPVALFADVLSSPLAYIDASGFGEERAVFDLDGEVAIVDVSGPLLQEAFTLCGFAIADGYDTIGARFAEAFASESVGGVVARVNSPGGVCAGCNETAAMLRSLASESGKPLVVYVDEGAFSAAYWLASAADEIVVPETGAVGSIGVFWPSINEHVALTAKGLVPILAADPPGKSLAAAPELMPPTSGQIERMQAHVEEIMAVFAGHVSGRRGLSVEAIRSFDAGVFSGARAVENGLADRVGSKRSAIDSARKKIKRKVYSMPDEKPRYSASFYRLLGLDPDGSHSEEVIEKRAVERARLADLGASIVQSTGASTIEDAREIVGIYETSHARLPAVERELCIREVQFAVATGRIAPKDAFAPEATDRGYPALPALHHDYAGRSVAVLRARFSGMSAAPETIRQGEPRRAMAQRRLSASEASAAEKAGMTVEQYQAHLSRYDNGGNAEEIEE